MSLRENKCEEMNLPFKCINKPHLKSANIYITNKLSVSDCAHILKDIYVAPELYTSHLNISTQKSQEKMSMQT